jgi:3-hydroxyacyl-CoA dehydrogenase/enoyl-CoA hydratase/3-hydroxybutyryl-CoA epimerase
MDMAENIRHMRVSTDGDGIAWLHLDRESSSTNVLTEDVLDSLENTLGALRGQAPRGLVILSDKPSGFVAGADVNAFTGITKEEEALTLIRRGQAVFTLLAAQPFPTVALIHGYCLGGGLELALACRHRVARDDPGTRLGLPEVRLGIHPGFGGSVRLPALIGGLGAMDLMLSGRTVSARQAGGMGLVDLAVPERQLRRAARELILSSRPAHRPRWWAALTNSALARPLLARLLQRRVAARAPQDYYPAPYALIDAWREHAGDPGRMMDAEAHSVARLITGATARNLVRVFLLQERLKGLNRNSTFVPQHVHVVGAGTMGGDIAAWCAIQGMRVSLQDQSPERIAPAIRRAHALCTRRLKRPGSIESAMDRLMPDQHGAGLRRADVVIEAIFEDAEAKRALYRALEPTMKPEALLATNTSSIPLEELAAGLNRPERLVGLHFFNPVAMMQLVEVVKGRESAPDAVANAIAFTRRIDRLPLPVTSSPGFLVNRILMPYLTEAVVMESEGVPAAAIDQAARAFGMPMGPVELADNVGLDVCLHVAEILAGHFDTPVPDRLRKLVSDGHLGRKTDRGFYRYRKGRAIGTKPPRGYRAPADITDRLILRMVNEAVACLRATVVEDAGLLDAGMVYGTGFAPFRGGPMRYIQETGRQTMLRRLQAAQDTHGPRFTPDRGWTTLEL